MNTPDVCYYAKMVNTTNGRKTPKYTITKQCGYYPPMEQLKGKNGLISMYLVQQSREDNGSTPPMKLQAKNSLNFTGLKDLWREGEMSGFAYGNPLDKETYSKDNKRNPFYEYRADGFLFIIHSNEKDTTDLTPTSIELIVIPNGGNLISGYCKQLEMGGFDKKLKSWREQADNNI